MFKYIQKLLSYIDEVFSEKGTPSSKRWIAFLIIIVVCFNVTREVINNGITDNAKEVLITLVIVAGSLLGITKLVEGFKKDELKE